MDAQPVHPYVSDSAASWRGGFGRMVADRADEQPDERDLLMLDGKREARQMADRDLADYVLSQRRFLAEAPDLGVDGFDLRWQQARLDSAVEEGQRRRRLERTAGLRVDARPSDRVPRIKERVRLEDAIADRIGGPDRHQGKNWWWRCPFHEERSASFECDVVKQLWTCFSCQAGGDLLRFVELLEGCGFLQALESLEQRYGIVAPAVTPRVVGIPTTRAHG